MAAALERFQFEDRIYYRQYRKCNRPQCKCHSGQPAHMHGPYWYARFEYSKGTRYIGKSLPQHVSQARQRYMQLADRIKQQAAYHQFRLAYLQQLIKRGTLAAQDEIVF